jgi:cupin 2 domain-containing protein
VGAPQETVVVKSGNVFDGVPTRLEDEEISVLSTPPATRVERIVSTGQASSPGFWYDQTWTEWLVLLSGSAGVLIYGESAPRLLRPGDFLEIPPHVRHRVEWTDPEHPTVWLAVHSGRLND